MFESNDCNQLTGIHRQYHERIAGFIPSDRLFCGPFTNLAYGDDASFYRLVPKIVVKARTPEEVSKLLAAASELKVPVTFRTAGTSLSGQALTDSVLIYLSGAWKGLHIHPLAEHISLEPGVIGAEANFQLAPFGKKIGPDPASINAAMIGGIAANNASGMCCGTAENSYKTVESMKLIFADGSTLDTADPKSRRAFTTAHPKLVAELAAIRDEITADTPLAERVRRKFKIKNTTGYGINSFVDFTDPIDILLHLMVGSEGTLAFISEVTYRTVVEHPHKASAMMYYATIADACNATIALKKGPVSAVELMDRASLRSVEDKPGMPAFLNELPDTAAAILVETRAADEKTLLRQIDEIQGLVSKIKALHPIVFMDQPADYNKLWNIRKGLFPAVGAVRDPGTTVVIEDVVFPIEKLAHGTVELQELMHKHGFPEGIIFGHALEGNLHFVFCPNFGSRKMIENYQALMEEVADMVVGRYDGSLKGEHGTGRNMAPFVEMEWGRQAYAYMVRLKKAFDPDNLLNPGVIINDNPNVYLENLKPMPAVDEIIDRCIECGFCEPVCPSRTITSTPRQRIALQRHMARIQHSSDEELMKKFWEHYTYFGEQTCAADGLCATVCPVSIDTGRFTKELRGRRASGTSRKLAQWVANHYGLAMKRVRQLLKVAGFAHRVLGTYLMEQLAGSLRELSGNRIPLWNKWMPGGLPSKSFTDTTRGKGRQVVYFPSCVARSMGPAKGDPDQRALYEATLSVLSKAGYDVIYPTGMADLCCGLTFESKGFMEQADQKGRELEAELRRVSQNGGIPILFDTSPCLYTMRRKIEPDLKLYEAAEFIHDFLMDKLHFTRAPETVALHVTCSSVKMGLSGKCRAVLEACAEKVILPRNIYCCGFAGDRGFNFPELNEAALDGLTEQLPPETVAGYSNSRTCEIGLSRNTGVPYQSIVYLVDRCTVAK
ncbi:FAD-binding and (Fe-S)-binding domain-containing protein [Fundidesulfovibrio terrae]|uniref:FAD-binding and (Fe-S)-binding domain-containing protein n=1 Tax=Fundidesulfovibrio terrae TaxID=2922866 RepID=UPI001FAFD98E|nr:FAD-binding and (Fe-S)-binding domain-containing protein [Fundidesulfovibrio terrae]